MELIASIPLLGPILATVIPFLVVLSVVVFVHELGHLMVGRWCGIGAEVFSVGFGKVLWARTDSRGTRWQVAAVPLGGYVKFTGDMDPSSVGHADDSDLTPEQRAHAFHNAALWKRTLTVLAGPVANFILSILVFAALYFASGEPSDEPVIGSLTEQGAVETPFQPGDRILAVDGEPVETFGAALRAMARTNGAEIPVLIVREGAEQVLDVSYATPTIIIQISPASAAANVGIMPGDSVLAIDGQQMTTARDVELAMVTIPPGKEITVDVERAGERLQFTFTPNVVERRHPDTGESVPLPTMGVSLGGTILLEPEMGWLMPWDAIYWGTLKVGEVITGTVLTIQQMLFHGADTSQLSGPIGIAKFSGQAAERGGMAFVQLIALLSTAIGFFNLLPVPVLDGGHLMFYAAEAVRGRPLGERWQQFGTMVGLSLVLLLMVFVTYNDILKL